MPDVAVANLSVGRSAILRLRLEVVRPLAANGMRSGSTPSDIGGPKVRGGYKWL